MAKGEPPLTGRPLATGYTTPGAGPLSGHRAKTQLATPLGRRRYTAKRGPHPRLATYRPIGSPLGRRNFGHWPHSTGCLSGQKGEAGLRLLATFGPHP